MLKPNLDTEKFRSIFFGGSDEETQKVNLWALLFAAILMLIIIFFLAGDAEDLKWLRY